MWQETRDDDVGQPCGFSPAYAVEVWPDAPFNDWRCVRVSQVSPVSKLGRYDADRSVNFPIHGE